MAREQLTGWLHDVGVPGEHVEGAAVLLVAVLDGLLLHHAVDPALPLAWAADAVLARGRGSQLRSAGTTSCSKSSMPLVS